MDTPECPNAKTPPQSVGSGQADIGLLRVLDAAANRAREAARAIEDFARFVLDDPHLTGLCKQLRHRLAELAGRVPLGDRLAARQTEADVGTALSTPTERSRESAAALLEANCARLQEALRSLEEFAKLHDPPAAAEYRVLRYRSYTLQRALYITHHSAKRLARARLYVLIDGRGSFDEFDSLARALVLASVHVIQLRDKQLDDRTLLGRARHLRELTTGSQTLFVMNDRPDLARLSRADGVHLGQDELSVKDARSVVGPHALIGVSTHSIEQARQAVLDGANYLGCGPVFPSPTKHFERFVGVELLRAVAAEIRLPVFAIGGINRANLREVLKTGICRVAVSSAILEAGDPAAEARAMLEMLGTLAGQ